jgi:hypothetical protein
MSCKVNFVPSVKICAITDTLILDEDGIYHPGDFNDRLLLGLKGTMSEVELHLIRARMRGGVLNKAKRGELETPLPFGFAYDDEGRVALDPDQQVQQGCPNRVRDVSTCGFGSGYSMDLAVGAMLVETATPLALEVALSVQQEMQSRWDETDRLRRLQVDRAR